MKRGLIGVVIVIVGLITVGAVVTPNSFLWRALPSGGAQFATADQKATVPSTGAAQSSRSGGSTSVIAGPVAPKDSTTPAIQGPPVIRTAQITLGVKSGQFSSSFADVRSLVEAEGGIIAGSDAQQSDPNSTDGIRTGVVTFEVPANKFETVIDALFSMGSIRATHIAGQDVSGQYIDYQARLRNAQAQRDAMLLLMQQAKTVNEIIAVQQQLSQITGQIEQLKGQIANLDHQTTWATISVTIHEAGVVPAAQPPADEWGFKTAVADAAHNFVTTVNLAVAGLGAAGPFMILAGLGYVLWKRRSRLGLGSTA